MLWELHLLVSYNKELVRTLWVLPLGSLPRTVTKAPVTKGSAGAPRATAEPRCGLQQRTPPVHCRSYGLGQHKAHTISAQDEATGEGGSQEKDSLVQDLVSATELSR